MIDSHCHLDFPQFDGIREECLQEAQQVGVYTIINIGTDIATSERSVALGKQHDMIFAAVGVHPHDAKTLDDTALDRLRELAAEPKVKAIGEIGLDYYRDLSPRPVQKQALHRQLRLAVEVGLPVVIHTREAFEDTLAIVNEYASDLLGGVFHCFPGDRGDAERVFALGFVISVGGVITYKNSGMARMAATVPLEKILIETDAPYLTPVPFRGKPNRPAYVRFVRDRLAELQQTTPEIVERTTDRTCRKLFRLAEIFEG